MSLLLHACCADCLLKFLESAKADNFETIDVFYYNPNIHPRSEYQSRLAAVKEVLPKDIKLIVPDWKPQDYFNVIESSQGRCPKCWQLRLSKTAKYAKEKKYTHFSSTLITSHYQDQKAIKKIALSLSSKALSFYSSKVLSCDLKTSGFYKQFFCGCCFSLTERLLDKFTITNH